MRGVTVRRAVAAVVVAGLAAGATAWRLAPSGPPGEGGYGRGAQVVASNAARPARHVRPAGPAPTLIITLRAATTYSSRPGGPAIGTLPPTNPFGQPEALAVVGAMSPHGWAEVELPVRPDGSVGWVRTSGVVWTETGYRVAVSLEARTLSVYDGAKRVLTTPAAIGAQNTPTPAARTYLWELIRPDDQQGAYGPYIFGLALFSNAIAVFNGGDAQIGIHGQDEPWSVGRASSHGCVRLYNDVITELAKMLPLGTPVTIA